MAEASVRDQLGARSGTTDSLKRVLQNRRFPAGNEGGFVLVASLVILVALTMLGVFATSTSNIEALIAGNDSLAKQTFYAADAGTIVGIEQIEQNVGCPTGFDSTRTSIGGVDLYDQTFALDEFMTDIPGGNTVLVPYKDDPDHPPSFLPSDPIRTIRIAADPANRVDVDPITNLPVPHTNVALWGTTGKDPGFSDEMIAGYDHAGRGSLGATITYDVHSQHIGVRNSAAIVAIKWRHMIGQEGTCNY